ncbi:MAG: hypothetical protein D5S00_04000 [Tindallia sp. MSAO_Bac2]|nr:MAG: hypothetical protein D5S00_04000 [Tindallia sp. MSAO_Bac2]
MDTLVYSLIRITLMILIFRSVIKLMGGGGFATRSIKRSEPQSSTPSDTEEAEANEKKPEPPKMVEDEVTKKPIAEHKAYILVDDEGNRRYFADWDSRQLYIQSKST